MLFRSEESRSAGKSRELELAHGASGFGQGLTFDDDDDDERRNVTSNFAVA